MDRLHHYGRDDSGALYELAVISRRRGDRAPWGVAVSRLVVLEQWNLLADAFLGSPLPWLRSYYPVTGRCASSWKVAARCLRALEGPDWWLWLQQHSLDSCVAGILHGDDRDLSEAVRADWNRLLAEGVSQRILAKGKRGPVLWVRVPVPSLDTRMR